MKKYTFSIDEFGDTDAEFYALYASFRMFYEIKKHQNKGNQISVAGMAAYNFLMELNEQDHDNFKDAEEEFNAVYGKEPTIQNWTNMICIKKRSEKSEVKQIIKLENQASGEVFYINGNDKNFEFPITVDIQEAKLFDTMLAATTFLSEMKAKFGKFFDNYFPSINPVEVVEKEKS